MTKNEHQAISIVCDAALKQGGIQVLQAVNIIQNYVAQNYKPEPEPKNKEKVNEKKNKK